MKGLSIRRFTGLTTLLLSFFHPTHPLATSSPHLIDPNFYHIQETGISSKLPLLVQRRVSGLEKHLLHHVLPRHTLQAFESAVHFVDEFYHPSSSSSSSSCVSVKDQEEGMAMAQTKAEAKVKAEVKAVILDSGCGRGKSTILLAKQFPHLPVIGIDRSLARLSSNHLYYDNNNNNNNKMNKNREEHTEEDDDDREEEEEVDRELSSLPNVLLLRADLSSFWFLASLRSDWQVIQHYLLHPNPYPKDKLLHQRLYLDASYPLALSLGGEWIVRSSWRTYCEELAFTTDYIMKKVNPSFPTPCTADFHTTKPWSHFEAKFLTAGVPLYEVRMQLGEKSPADRKAFLTQLMMMKEEDLNNKIT